MCSLDSGSPNFLMLFCQRATTFIEVGGRVEGGSLYHQVFALKMYKHCQKILYLFLSAYKTVHLKIGWIQTVETFFQSANHHQDHNVDPDAKLRLALVTDDLIN